MRQNELYALVRSTLLAGLTGVEVRANYQPSTVAIPSGPQITMQIIASRRIGAMKRKETLDGDSFIHEEIQWWESTLQIGATARRLPEDLTLPTAMDICKAASDILQSDAGLSALAVQRVRPLRISNVRVVQWVNESNQYETMPNFDLVLVHPETVTGTTPPAISIEPVFGRV